jgi:hypothetical protein
MGLPVCEPQKNRVGAATVYRRLFGTMGIRGVWRESRSRIIPPDQTYTEMD